MNPAIPSVLLVAMLNPALPVAAQGSAGQGNVDGTRGPSLDLSLPPDAPSATWTRSPAQGTAGLPDLGSPPSDDAGHGQAGPATGRASEGSPRTEGAGAAQRGGGFAADLPYGAGYEARQGDLGQTRGGGRGR